MKQILYSLIGLVSFLSACKKSKSESEKPDIAYAPFTEAWIIKKQKGIDFFALGTEPFWNLEVGSQDMMKFYEIGRSDTIKVPVPSLYRDKKSNSWIYKGKSNYGSLEVTIRNGECSDNMSDTKYNYSAEIIVRYAGKKEDKKFSGCGSFLNDYRLNDIFALTIINGREVKQEDFLNGLPYIELNLPTGKIMGKAGCNSFNGNMKVELNGKEIVFGPFASTRMSCPQIKLEDEFLKALSNNKVEYSFTKERLVLVSGDNKLEFKKVD